MEEFLKIHNSSYLCFYSDQDRKHRQNKYLSLHGLPTPSASNQPQQVTKSSMSSAKAPVSLDQELVYPKESENIDLPLPSPRLYHSVPHSCPQKRWREACVRNPVTDFTKLMSALFLLFHVKLFISINQGL